MVFPGHLLSPADALQTFAEHQEINLDLITLNVAQGRSYYFKHNVVSVSTMKCIGNVKQLKQCILLMQERVPWKLSLDHC